MRLGIRDHKVLSAFAAHRPAEGQKLSTDGQRLDGHWLGGTGIAAWEGDQIVLRDLGSRSAQSVQRQLRGHAAPVQFADFPGIGGGRRGRAHATIKKTSQQLNREIQEFLRGHNPHHSTEYLAHHGHEGAHGYASREHHGRRNPGRWHGTEVQSLLFHRPEWTVSRAKAWAKKEGYHYGAVDVKENYVHLRQFDPVPGTEKRTQEFGKGIKAVLEQVK